MSSSGKVLGQNATAPQEPFRLANLGHVVPPSASRDTATHAMADDPDIDHDLPDLREREGNLLSPLPSANRFSGRLSRVLTKGGLGDFLYRSSVGSQVYVAFLVIVVGGCETGLVILNRFLFMTGTWRFPYPVALTFAQVLATHIMILIAASVTRTFWKPLSWLGLTGLIAPPRSMLRASGRLGIDYRSLGLLLPLVVTFVIKLLFSTLSFAYAILPKYTIARIYTVPASLIMTFAFFRTSHSLSTILSSLTSVFYLGMASSQSTPPVDLQSTILAFLSTAFVALYPVLFLFTYNKTLKSITAPRENGHVTTSSSLEATDAHRADAHWQLLHHLSLLTLLIMTLALLLSGDIFRIWTGCYILDEYKLWIPVVGSFLTSFGVFVATPLLIRATSPLSATFLMVPRSAFQLALLHGDMPVSCWVGVYGCYLSSVWYLTIRRGENGPWY